MSIVLLDTSALVKLVRTEAESDALRGWLGAPTRGIAELLCSALVLTELPRALRRIAPGRDLPAYRAVLDRLTLYAVDEDVLVAAGELEDPLLRSLDAIHLATARALADAAGEQFEALVTYDLRMKDAAMRLGVAVVAPA